jgi:hypothetical protein
MWFVTESNRVLIHTHDALTNELTTKNISNNGSHHYVSLSLSLADIQRETNYGGE